MNVLQKILPNLGQPSAEARRFIAEEKAANATERNSFVTQQGKQLQELRYRELSRLQPQFELLMAGTPKCETCVSYQEGFSSQIFANNPVQVKNTSEATEMTTLTTLMNQKLAAFKQAQKTLMDAVARFLGTNAAREDRVNYNVYTSRGADLEKIAVKEEGCYTIPLNDSLEAQNDMGSGVSLTDCKRRAADTGKSVFGVTSKNAECYTGTDIKTVQSTSTQGLQMKSALVLNESPFANSMQMMYNGQTAVYDVSTPTNLSYTTKYTGATTCDPLIGGKINVLSATFGGNCPVASR